MMRMRVGVGELELAMSDTVCTNVRWGEMRGGVSQREESAELYSAFQTLDVILVDDGVRI